MRRQLAPHRGVADLATRQGGVVSREQLLQLGLGDDAIDHRLQTGGLLAVHRGVYAVGHLALGPRGRRFAAVLACGPGAVLSHATAASVWDLRPTRSTRIDVMVPTRAGRATRAGIRIHRPRAFPHEQTTTKDGLPLTDPSRTLIDIASVLGRAGLERAIEQADLLGLLDADALWSSIAASPRRRGMPALAALLAHHRPPQLTRSAVERRFVRLCREHGLPAPSVNTWLDAFELDFLWRDHRLVAEVDSYRYHATRGAFERDRARDQRLTVLGFRVVRFSDLQVTYRPGEVAGTLRSLLRRSGSS